MCEDAADGIEIVSVTGRTRYSSPSSCWEHAAGHAKHDSVKLALTRGRCRGIVTHTPSQHSVSVAVGSVRM